MFKRLLLVCTTLLASYGALFAQERQAMNAKVLSDERTFTLASPTSGEFKVNRVVEVYNEKGDGEAIFFEYTDQFHTLSSFKGLLEKAGAKPVKIGKSDLQSMSLSSGLAEDGFITAYGPTSAYPYKITYEYTVTLKKGIAVFPMLSPVRTENTAVQYASYILNVPHGTQIQFFCNLAEGPERTDNGKTDVYKWEVKDYGGYTSEYLMPSWTKQIPFVMTAPVNFVYAGTTGSQESWEAVGRWCASLQEDTGKLSPEFTEKVTALTKDCKNNLEKVKVLYNYLRENTRYVSVQFGIGGYKPAEAAQVQKAGFGDCKGLSNFMQSMLAAIGIESEYVILHTDRKLVYPGFTNFGQMNHAMLCVPLPEVSDTLWLECTNPAYPLGYRHEGIAGHDVVLVSPKSSKLVRVPGYADSLSCRTLTTDVLLKPDGSATVSVNREVDLDYTERWISIRNWKEDDVRSSLSRGLRVQPQNFKLGRVTDNFGAYEGPHYCPRMSIDYSFDCRQYATGSGDRLFLAANPVSSNFPVQRTKRINDIYSDNFGTTIDKIVIHIPEGYEPENLPGAVTLDTDWGRFKAEAAQEGDTIVVLQEFTLKTFDKPAAEYPSLKSFLRTVNKAYDAGIVLRKKQ